MPRSPRRRILFYLLSVSAIAIVAVIVGLTYITKSTPILRDRVVTALNQRFQSQVQMSALQVSAFPRPGLSGAGLELRHNGRTDVPPLISIREFEGTAGLAGLFQSPLHLRTVSLDGLTIQIPPGGLKQAARDAVAAQRPSRRHPTLSVDRVEAASAWLEIASKNPLKPPRVFDIHEMVLTGFRPDRAAGFHARLTNAIPEGEIHTDGNFGPWLAGDPGSTAVDGHFTLDKAQMSDIKGLRGVLTASGNYNGTLERIAVNGETRTPDFALGKANPAVPLNTTFVAVVDGTNGDTFLNEITATLASTVILAHGAVVRSRELKGRHITLDTSIAGGEIADILKLVLKPGTTPLSGRITVAAHLNVPAGPRDVIDKMELDGRFSLTQAHFNSFNVQKRINVLSKRARGDEGDDAAASVVSNMSGQFRMREAAITLTSLTFAIPGARVELAGHYAIHSETMDFRGVLLLDASLSDTTSGFKAVAARIVQPFFRRPGGGSRLPIKIQGTRDKPSFGLDVRRAFLPG